MRWLREQAERRPDQSFLNGYSYKEIYNRAVLMAGFLDASVKHRSRVGVCSENSVEMVVLLFALWLMGKEVFLVNPQLSVEERMTQAIMVDVDLIYTSAQVQQRVVAEQEALDSDSLETGKAHVCSLAGCVNAAVAQIRYDEKLVQWQTMPVLPLMAEQTVNSLVHCFESLLAPGEGSAETPSDAPAETPAEAPSDAPAEAICTVEIMNGFETSKPRSADKELADNRIAAIMSTSATTGKMKAVPLRWEQIEAHVKASAQVLGCTDKDNWLIVLPMFHVSGLSILMRTLYNGTAATIHKSFDEETVLGAITSGKINMVSLVPTVLQRIVNRISTHALRVILLGGEFIPNALVETCIAKQLPIFKTYGMTETFAQSTTVDILKHPDKWKSVGRPLPGVTIEIRPFNENPDEGNNGKSNDESNDKVNGGLNSEPNDKLNGKSSGEPKDESKNTLKDESEYESKDEPYGEIWLTSPMLMTGYLGQPPLSGYFNTGDLGYVDEDGFLYVVNRRKDLIISGGENIYPREIEDVLYEMPGIKECAVVPKADAKWGQIPVLFYAGDAQEEDVQEFLKTRLGRYKQPKEIHKLDSLPRNSSGKILRKDLV